MERALGACAATPGRRVEREGNKDPLSMYGWLSRLFLLEEINGGERCPTYLYRWTLLKWRGRGVYLHRFVGDDWSRDLHDHPKRFISIGLWGSYVEETPCWAHKEPWHNPHCGRGSEKRYRAPWIRTFPATHIHRLRLIDGHECWTLVIVLKAERPWGFWHLGQWIPWYQYVRSKMADDAKACP